MITICQHTGFAFEAESKRSKNHPLVAAFLNDAAKDNGHYRGASHVAKQLVTEATGYESIEELIADVRSAYAGWQATGESRKVVKTHKELIEAGERRIAWATRKPYERKMGAW